MSLYLYVPGRSLLHRLDPRAKLAGLLAVLLLAVATDYPAVPGALLGLTLAGAAAARAWPALRRVRGLALTVFLFSLVVWSLLARGQTPWLGPVSRESALFGLATGLKLATMILSSTLFLATTRNEEIVAGLIRLGLPYPVGFAFSTALRLVPAFIGAALTIAEAQRARGLDLDAGGPLARIRKHLPLVVPVFASALRSTNQLAMAIEARGFGARPRRSSYLELRFGPGDRLFAAAALAAAAAALVLAVSGAGRLPGLLR